MKPHKNSKDKFELELKRKWRKYEKLCDQARGLGYVELDEPRRDGWKLTLVLKAETKNRKDSDRYQIALDLVNRFYYSPDRNWDKRLSKAHTPNMSDEYYSIFGINLRDNIYFYPKRITSKMYDGLDQYVKKLFVPSSTGKTYSFANIQRYCEMKDSKHWLTKVPIFDPVIESERTKLWDDLYDNGYYPKICKLLGYNSHHDDWDYEGKRKKLKDIKTYHKQCIDDALNNA